MCVFYTWFAGHMFCALVKERPGGDGPISEVGSGLGVAHTLVSVPLVLSLPPLNMMPLVIRQLEEVVDGATLNAFRAAPAGLEPPLRGWLFDLALAIGRHRQQDSGQE